MSFLGGAECSTAANPLSQFTKHVQDDKSLQRDRLVGTGPGGLQETFRSQRGGPPQDEVERPSTPNKRLLKSFNEKKTDRFRRQCNNLYSKMDNYSKNRSSPSPWSRCGGISKATGQGPRRLAHHSGRQSSIHKSRQEWRVPSRVRSLLDMFHLDSAMQSFNSSSTRLSKIPQ